MSEGHVSEQEILASLLSLPGVVRVAVVRAQGVLKHFVVTVAFPGSDPATSWRLAGLWPFSTSEVDVASGSTSVDFLVRPEEAGRFRTVLGGGGARGREGGGNARDK